jgi:hypothetical protein
MPTLFRYQTPVERDRYAQERRLSVLCMFCFLLKKFVSAILRSVLYGPVIEKEVPSFCLIVYLIKNG